VVRLRRMPTTRERWGSTLRPQAENVGLDEVGRSAKRCSATFFGKLKGSKSLNLSRISMRDPEGNPFGTSKRVSFSTADVRLLD
jgi:hypothetical protein